MQFDVLIIGAGPAGLSAAIRLQQLAQENHRPLSICILEKGAHVGAHLLSGAVLNPCSLKTLLPDTWEQAPLETPVTHDHFYWLSSRQAYKLPTPPQMRNRSHYIVRLGYLSEFLGKTAEALGCEIYPSFSATELVFDDRDAIIGVKTGPMGLDKTGHPKPHFQPGMTLNASLTLFAEGCRGQLSEQLIRHYHLRAHSAPQSYGLGIKELWQLKTPKHPVGTVIHSIGWPLDKHTYGGSFMYYLTHDLLALGLVVGLDYTNPYLSPFEEFQRFKKHPWVTPLITGGERIAYGAKALNEGGWQAIPQLTFPGGALIGDAAGFLNVPQIKGIHTAIQSGIIAAEAAFKQLSLQKPDAPIHLTDYPTQLKQSWVGKALYQARNIRPGFRFGLLFGLVNAAFETYISRGYSPWTLRLPYDDRSLSKAAEAKPIAYPKPDGIFTFDRLSSVYLTQLFQEADQPCHLKLRDPSRAISVNYEQYASPETRYCPAAVYEILTSPSGKPQLQINAQNCIHCKTCDIKDPTQNIEWTAPEGGGGPRYSGL